MIPFVELSGIFKMQINNFKYQIKYNKSSITHSKYPIQYFMIDYILLENKDTFFGP